MNGYGGLLATLRNILRGTTPDATRATVLPPLPGPVVKVERPSPMPCTPQMRCDSCRRRGVLPKPGEAS